MDDFTHSEIDVSELPCKQLANAIERKQISELSSILFTNGRVLRASVRRLVESWAHLTNLNESMESGGGGGGGGGGRN